MSKSTHRENERLRKMQERVDAKTAELQRLARQQKEELDFSASKHELERLSQWELLTGKHPRHVRVEVHADFERDAQVITAVDERTGLRTRHMITNEKIADDFSTREFFLFYKNARSGLEPYVSMYRQSIERATAEHNLAASGPLPWEPIPGLIPPGTPVAIISSSTGVVTERRKWVTDFQHVLDALEGLGFVAKITPVDGMPEHVVIELADGGGWLYYGPDQGLRTLTAKQARHYMACEAERHVEEGVWA